MRTIKFRAWDRKRKEMFPVHELQFDKISNSLDLCKGYDDHDSDGWTVHGGFDKGFANGPQFVLMQYTGLTDRNGVEIFEGDLVSDNLGTGKVEYREKRGGYRVTYPDGTAKWFVDYTDNDLKTIEVVGNVYESTLE